ncbi:hypothetical protein ART_4238 [Arthrobacter sp. PAMC 25486]|nr:hypothetical protein ART_4238 [Arthrobacter sp. PAMC 25486]
MARGRPLANSRNSSQRACSWVLSQCVSSGGSCSGGRCGVCPGVCPGVRPGTTGAAESLRVIAFLTFLSIS